MTVNAPPALFTWTLAVGCSDEMKFATDRKRKASARKKKTLTMVQFVLSAATRKSKVNKHQMIRYMPMAKEKARWLPLYAPLISRDGIRNIA